MGINDKSWLIGFKRLIGDESLGETGAIVVDDTNKQIHIIGILDAGLDLSLSADSYPSLYIHGTASATEYIKMYTDSTDAHFNVVGANLDIDVPTGGSVSLQVNNTDEYEFSASNFSFLGNTLGSAGNLTFVSGRTIVGTNLIIDAPGTAVQMKATASWAATGTGTVGAAGVLGPAEIGSVSLKTWLKVLDAPGTAIVWIPGYAP